ncbi:MAG TPA: response regulator [Terriglobia bacterium]|jgi:DNA-binding NtrC family response regulator|nr:response regulator [Terriglobia bacterium]
MVEQISALVVCNSGEAFGELTRALESLGIAVTHARNSHEASRLLKSQMGIDVVFAGSDLPDGGWADVLGLAQQIRNYLPVIVVSRIVDVGLYIETIGRGAFDFVTPPFLTSELAHVIRSAIYKKLVSVKQDMTARPAV